jgi:hypothetical protein
MFRALASKEKLTSRGNVPLVDGLRSLTLDDSERFSTHNSVDLASHDDYEWVASTDYGRSGQTGGNVDMNLDFQELSSDQIRPMTGMTVSRPGTVASIDESEEFAGVESGSGIRFGGSMFDDDDDGELTATAPDPFAQPFDLA